MHVKRLSAIGYGHFAIDTLNSSIAIILTYLSGQYDLSVSQIGFGSMVYVFAASLTQPLFGLLADKVNGRWMGAIGLLWTITFYAMIPFATDYRSLLVILLLAALGSAAFHPVGIVNASEAGGRYPTTSTSIFFLLGQSGLALGPVISGIVLQRYGISALPIVAIAMLPAVIMMAIYLRQPMAAYEAHDHGPVAPTSRPAVQVSTAVIVAFVLAIALRATTIQAYVTLLPKYFSDLGYTSAAYGIMIGVFSFAGALGTFAGGYLGDRIERRRLMATALVLSIPFSLALLNLHGAWGYFVAAALAGALLNIPHSILLIVGQELLPKRKGLMGGMVLGFMFASGAAFTWVASWFADIIGLSVVLTALAFLPLGAAATVMMLPKARAVIIENSDVEHDDNIDPQPASVAAD